MRPVNKIAQRFGVKTEFGFGHIRDKFRAGFTRGVEKFLARMIGAKVCLVFRCEKRRLVMIEPPGQLLRR